VPIVVVGGHTRNIGKTALVEDIIRAFPKAVWTAIKITQFGHGECAAGAGCDCAPRDHAFALDRETVRDSGTDSSRFLAAGAARSFWLRTKQGQLALGMPALRGVLADGGFSILESNSVLRFVRPALYLVVLDPTRQDFKPSARVNLNRADAFVRRSTAPDGWTEIPRTLLQSRPAYVQPLGTDLPAEMVEWLRGRLFGNCPLTAPTPEGKTP